MTSQKPIVTVVIVTYQSRETIEATLDALLEVVNQNLAYTVLVDNASPDQTADFVAQHYPWVNLVRNRRNIGFGKGCNLGFEYVKTPYILLLNPDAVVDLKAMTAMTNFMEGHPCAGICGPAVIEASGALQPSGGAPTPWKIMVRPLLPGLVSNGRRHIAPGEAPSVTDWICGSIMLIRSKVIEEIGGFDPRFFLYFEETDLCNRAQKVGWEIWTVGESICKHVNAASAKATKEHMIWGTLSEHYFKSRFYYLIKHFGWPYAIFTELGELALMFVRALLDWVRKRPYKDLGPRLRSPILKLPSPVDDTNRGEK